MAQLSNTTIPDLSDGNERLDASLNSFLVSPSPLAHAQSLCKSLVEQIRIQFESSQREASELFETRQSLLLEKAKQSLASSRRSFRMPHFISSVSLDASRLQRSIEQLESHIAHLLSSSLAATGTLLASTAEPLSTAFAALFAAPQPSDSFFPCLFASHKGVSSLGGLALPSSRALNDFDSLLLSAFSPTPSVSSLTAGIHSRQLSNLDSAQSLSANTAEFLVSSVSETPVTEQDFSPLPAEPIDSPAGVSPTEVTEGTDVSPEIAPFFGKKVRVFQLVGGSPRELLASNSYDVVSASRGGSFTLFLTSRGTVLSLAEGEDCVAGSGIRALSASLRTEPRLIPSLQVERALRHKRLSEVITTGKASFALATTGELYSWGDGPAGELGLGEITQQSQAEVRDSRGTER